MASARLTHVLQETIAGLIWLYLDLPADASRDEVEDYADELIACIREGAKADVLEQRIRHLHFQRFCISSNARAMHTLVERSVAILRLDPVSLPSLEAA